MHAWCAFVHADAFKRRLDFSYTVIISALNNNFLLLLKSYITKALEYKGDLNFKNQLYVLLSMYFLVMSPCSCAMTYGSLQKSFHQVYEPL